jgi:hypothetical protein
MTPEEQSIYNNAFSLALWKGLPDEEANGIADAAVEEFRQAQEDGRTAEYF